MSDIFYDFNSTTWTYRDSWWAEGLLHRGGRIFVITIAVSSLVIGITLQFHTKFKVLKKYSKDFFQLSISSASCSIIIALLKKLTGLPCPYEVLRYGGNAIHNDQLLPVFSLSISTSSYYGCFPAAHSGTAFSLFALYFIFKKYNISVATLSVVLVILLSICFSLVQIMRGSHFLSHNIWSGIICWASCWAIDRIFESKKQYHKQCL